MRTTVLAVSVVAALSGFGCGKGEDAGATGAATGAAQAPSGDRGLPGNAEAGAAVYARVCSACHGVDGKGNGGVTGADFVNDRARLQKNNAELLHSIAEGIQGPRGVMPPQKTALSEQEMKDALSYIRRQFGGTQ